ncbi:MAG: sigma-70 family RNA polymerase sigma factor [Phycisphaerales bacterium]|nr:sigma-70 family RNA polymerase sigma factor [Phycisphaerales bacterium]
MKTHVPERSNTQWLALLSKAGAEQSDAAQELAAYLRRVLAVMLQHMRVHDDDIEEFAQEALCRIVQQLDTFRDESRFTTWASAIAGRVAFTAIRRRRVREQHDDLFAQAQRTAHEMGQQHDMVERNEYRTRMLAALDQLIRNELTDRQRTVIVAELRGVPTIEIAERLKTNQNALYKLAHDARRKIRSGLIDAGFSATAIRNALGAEDTQ